MDGTDRGGRGERGREENQGTCPGSPGRRAPCRPLTASPGRCCERMRLREAGPPAAAARAARRENGCVGLRLLVGDEPLHSGFLARLPRPGSAPPGPPQARGHGAAATLMLSTVRLRWLSVCGMRCSQLEAVVCSVLIQAGRPSAVESVRVFFSVSA